jgi:hypothetical protein
MRHAPTAAEDVAVTPRSWEDAVVAQTLSIPFTLRGLSGAVSVSVTCNKDPDAIGSADTGLGFPVCRATVIYPAEGYAAMFGWTQMVRSTDSDPDRFEMDPFSLYRHLPIPYAFFGVRPELFDAPSRESRYDMVWEAHSFLCISPDSVVTRRVQAIAGFTWGFVIEHRDMTFAQPAALGPKAWDNHLDLLRTGYPDWIIDSGYLTA